MKYIKQTIFFISIILLISGCKNGKLPGSDARKIPYDPKERVKRNLEQGKGFRLNSAIGLDKKGVEIFSLRVQTNFGEHL